MSPFEIGLGSILIILLLLYSGVPVVVALGGTSLLCIWWIRGDLDIAIRLISIAANETISDYVFGVVPLFVLMGMFVTVAGIGRDTFEAANQVFRRVRGGLGVATVAANATFAAVTGVSIASAAVFSKVAVPEMLKAGYDRRLAVGIVAGSSILGMLIPPSLLLIIYAVLTDQSIGAMFLAAIIPGIIMSVAFGSAIVGMAWYRPHLVGLGQAAGQAPPVQSRLGVVALLGKLSPIVLLVAIVMGGIYGGIFTATEAGGVGAFAALVLALLRRSLDPTKLWRILTETGHVTASICLVIIGAGMYSRMLTISGVPTTIANWFMASGMPYSASMLIYMLIIILLGTILDSISILLIMVPLAFPIFMQMGVDPVWFGIVTVVAVEIGIISPPFGLGCFVVKSSLADKTIGLNDVFMGALPFVLIMLVVLAILVVFPSLSLFLVR